MKLVEKPHFVDSDGFSKTYHYSVFGTRDDDIARAWFLSQTPGVRATPWGNLYRNRPKLRHAAHDGFDVDVDYTKTPQEAGTFTISFDTAGGTVTVTAAKEHIQTIESLTAPSTPAPDFDGLINVDRTNQAVGTEIVIPALRVTVTFNHANAVVSQAYMNKLSDLTGTTNSTKFFNWEPSEVLFLGASGSDGTHSEASIAYSFAISRNATGLSIGNIVNVAKKGWHYLWIKYRDNPSNGYPGTKVDFVFVERVYDEVDFANQFGFGG